MEELKTIVPILEVKSQLTLLTVGKAEPQSGQLSSPPASLLALFIFPPLPAVSGVYMFPSCRLQ